MSSAPSSPTRRPGLGGLLRALAAAAFLAALPAAGANFQTFDLATIDTLLGLAHPGDTVVSSGDMLYRVADLQRYRSQLTAPTGGVAPRSAVRASAQPWPNGRVPYRFDASVTTTQRSQFVAAAAEWEAVANIDFVPATNETNYVYVLSSDENSSYVGMVGGPQELNMFNWDYRFIICHELAHALGVSHEQSRSDRDTYVTINFANIPTNQQHNFDKYADTTNVTPYDFDSVMHYSRYSFSSNGQPTITPKPAYASAAQDMGQRTHLSRYDIDGMVDIYGGVGTAASLKLRDTPRYIDDNTGGSVGNADGRPDRGETVLLDLVVRNFGTVTATDAQLTATESSSFAFFATATASLGSIAPGATARTTALRLVIPANTPYGHAIPVTLSFTANGQTWQESFTVNVAELPRPTVTPNGGFLLGPQSVSLATTVPGGAIRYTIDGSSPTAASPLYSAPFMVAANTTVQAISVASDGSLSLPTSAQFVLVPPIFDASIPFTQPELPAGWSLEVDPSLATQASIVNGRFEVREPDAVATVQHPLPPPAHANGFRVSYTANLAGNPLGMGTRLELGLAGGVEFFVSLIRPADDPTVAEFSVGSGTPAILQRSLSTDDGAYRVTAEFHDGRVTVDLRKSGATTPLIAEVLDAPDLAIHQLETLRFVAFTSTGDPAWLDDILVNALYPPPVVPARVPPPAPTVLALTAASAKQLRVRFSGQDSLTDRYVLELRSRNLRRKLSRWKQVGTVTPFGAGVYLTSIRAPKALQHQVRVTAQSTAGNATSVPLSLRPSTKKGP
jgi:hypothetical protein